MRKGKLILFSLKKNNVKQLIKFLFCSKIIKTNPYKSFNDTYKVIYIHIPKCAGQSIEKALFQEKVGHNKLWYYQYWDEKKYNQYYRFSFVRNPWERMVSAFFFLKQGGRNVSDKKWGETVLKDVDSFEDFVLLMKENKQFKKTVLKKDHFIPQYVFLENLSNKIDIDFIGKVENLQDDFKLLCKQLNIKETSLPHVNKSKHEQYAKYYSKKTKDIVASIYKKDISLFSYGFNDL